VASTRILAGQHLNHFARAVSAPALTTGAADALYPLANLYDGRPSKKFQFSAAVANGAITADLNLVKNPGFETSTLSDWTDNSSGTGTSAETTVGAEVHGGSKAMKLGGGASGVGQRYQDVTVRAGEWQLLVAWLRGDGTVNARLRVQNLQTGKYLVSDGTWSAAVTDLATQSAASYAEKPAAGGLQFQVESYATCRAHTVTLRIYCRVDQNGFGYFDDITLVPATDWLSIHGHNIEPLIALELRSSTDNFSSSNTLEATATVQRGRFYALLSARVFRRYWRVLFSGTPTAAIRVGEGVLGQTYTLAQSPVFPWRLRPKRPQIRTRTEVGEVRATGLVDDELHELEVPFQHRTTEWDELRQQLFERSRFGVDPAVVCPKDDEAFCMFTVVPELIEASRKFLNNWDDSFLLEELPFSLRVG
jgi:hypothetical protein